MDIKTFIILSNPDGFDYYWYYVCRESIYFAKLNT